MIKLLTNLYATIITFLVTLYTTLLSSLPFFSKTASISSSSNYLKPLILLGLDNAGKSTLLKLLTNLSNPNGNDDDNNGSGTQQTVKPYSPPFALNSPPVIKSAYADANANSKLLKSTARQFKAWDLGGHCAVRRLWDDYIMFHCSEKTSLATDDANDISDGSEGKGSCVVFMIDTTTPLRLSESFDELVNVISTMEEAGDIFQYVKWYTTHGASSSSYLEHKEEKRKSANEERIRNNLNKSSNSNNNNKSSSNNNANSSGSGNGGRKSYNDESDSDTSDSNDDGESSTSADKVGNIPKPNMKLAILLNKSDLPTSITLNSCLSQMNYTSLTTPISSKFNSSHSTLGNSKLNNLVRRFRNSWIKVFRGSVVSSEGIGEVFEWLGE